MVQGDRTSTQDSEVQGTKPDKNKFCEKIFLQMGQTPTILVSEDHKVKSLLSPPDQDEKLLSQHLQPKVHIKN